MLRIGELAELAGTSIRTIRHYHAERLLPEPRRDPSGHRRYGASELIALLRIRRLRELGVPLRDVHVTDPTGTHEILQKLEQNLEAQQQQLDARRRRIAELRLSVDPDLPADLAAYFNDFAAAGIDPALLVKEKETALLMLALAPAMADRLLGIYARMREDPTAIDAVIGIMRRFEAAESATLNPADVRQLVGDLLHLDPSWLGPDADTYGIEAAAVVFVDHLRSYSTPQRRLIEMVSEHAGRSTCPDAASGRQDSALRRNAEKRNGAVER